ncbi:MAG: hypothetical protein LC104_09095 [Bacteroidales bacterium]|nr:hypothetical protein [Bacteroidales bacterium]
MSTARSARIEQAYVAAHTQATELCDEICDRLQNMPAPDCDHPIHWGHVGDLRHIHHQLREILVFLKHGMKAGS